MATAKYRDPITKQFVPLLLGNGLSRAEGDAMYVKKTGDTMSGALNVPSGVVGDGPSGEITRSSVAGTAANIVFKSGSLLRWTLGKTSATESGSNTGTGLAITAWTDAGAYLLNAMLFTRSTGLATVVGDPTADLGIATKQYVDNGETGWVYPTLINGWVAYDARTPRYRRTRDGMVIWEGVVKNGTVGANICVVSAAHRPLRGNSDFIVSVAGGMCIFSLGVDGQASFVNQQPVGANPASYAYVNCVYNVLA